MESYIEAYYLSNSVAAPGIRESLTYGIEDCVIAILGGVGGSTAATSAATSTLSGVDKNTDDIYRRS